MSTSTATMNVDDEPMIELPTRWGEATTTSAAMSAQYMPAQYMDAPVSELVRWWTRFSDPLLSSLVEQALLRNVDVRRAEADRRRARAVREQRSALLWPVLDASADVRRDANSNERYSAALDSSWEIDLLGGIRAAVRSSDALAGASGVTLDDVRVSIAAEVVIDYVALRAAQGRVVIATTNASVQGETLQITRWRQQAGLVTALETAQGTAALAQTLAQRDALAREVEVDMHALAVLTGAAPAALNAQLDTRAGVPAVPAVAGGIVFGVPADTLRQRPDVRAAQLLVEAAQADVEQAVAARFPALRLSGSIGVSAATTSGLSAGDALLRALLASLSVPLFDGGERRATVRVQEAALAGARVDYVAAVLIALQDVEDVLSSMRGDRARLVHLREAAQSAGVAALLARQRYGSGLIDFLTVLDTQRTQLATQDAVVAAEGNVGIDHARLFKARGGGWSEEATQ